MARQRTWPKSIAAHPTLLRAARRLLLAAATLVLGGFLGATLVWMSPGFGIDVRAMDPRLSDESVAFRERASAQEENIALFYVHHLQRMALGDLGYSRSLQRPVSELLAQRLPLTFAWVSTGLALGWILALALSLPAVWARGTAYDATVSSIGALFLSMPAALLALVLVLFDGPGPVAIALAVFPRIFGYVRNLLKKACGQPYVLTARARGLTSGRILTRHILPGMSAPLIALGGVSVSLALGVAIPVEVISDAPGVGQLAWLAAQARDLTLLISLTMLVTVTTLVANSCADIAVGALENAR